MTNVYRKIPLSGSTHGRQIKVTGTASGSANTIHTALASTTDGQGDEVWIFATNNSAAERTLTIEFGGTTSPDDLIVTTIPGKGVAGNDGTIAVIPGLLLRNALVVKAFADSANDIMISGYVNRAS